MEAKKSSVFTAIEIHASPEEVWKVLTDWKSLAEWSSSFVGISEEKLVKGESFKAYFKNPLNGKILEFERVCTEYEEGKKFAWSGKLTPHHGFTDHHIFSLEPTESGTTLFKQEDGIHGKLSKIVNVLAKGHMKSMYEKFNQELKDKVESNAPGSQL